MNKHEFVERIASEAKLSKQDAHEAVEAVVKVLTDALANGDKVMLPDLGTFEVRRHAGREVRNAQTGSVTKIESSRIPTLRAGQRLLDALNTQLDYSE